MNFGFCFCFCFWVKLTSFLVKCFFFLVESFSKVVEGARHLVTLHEGYMGWKKYDGQCLYLNKATGCIVS